jgi:hypothetical protein
MTSEELADYVRASRERQGLPARITDPSAIARLALLMEPRATSDLAPRQPARAGVRLRSVG